MSSPLAWVIGSTKFARPLGAALALLLCSENVAATGTWRSASEIEPYDFSDSPPVQQSHEIPKKPSAEPLRNPPVAATPVAVVREPVSTSSSDISGYVLGIGDVIKIEVYDEPEMLTEARLQGAGAVNFPLLGSIKLSGLTVTQAQEEIRRRLAEGFIRNPTVRLNVTEFRRFFVTGEVKQPGGIAYVLGLTVGNAIAMAGGMTGRAQRDEIYLVPEGRNMEQKIRVEMDNAMRPGDTIIVEESFF